MGVGGNMGFVTSGDTTGDVVTYEVGVPGKLIGLEIGAMRTKAQGRVHVVCVVPMVPVVPIVTVAAL